VNADSMQLYAGMDIGTAKLPPDARHGVPHHLLDIWDVRQAASVAGYQAKARALVAELHARKLTPVVVGGSGLYVAAVLDDIEFPGTDPVVRAALEAELRAVGAKRLHARLAETDPGAAAAILDTNGRKIVRALEVRELTGRPFEARLRPRPAYPDIVVIGLRMNRADLDRRIDARVERMWQDGFVDEVRRLAAAGLSEGPTASKALGYEQVLRMLAGRAEESDARAETVRATRRFARRQESWFNRDQRICWLDVARGPEGVRAAALSQLAR